MVKYQGFDEYVKMFKMIHKLDSKCKFLILTPYVDKALPLLRNLPFGSYKILSAPFQEMNGYYNAADFGVLLRKNNAVNEIASPTKFGEYCMAGLPVIMNDSVRQSFKLGLKFGNVIPYRSDLSPSDLVLMDNVQRKEVSKKAAKVLSREALSSRYLKLYAF
jgi:hypothetical protein